MESKTLLHHSLCQYLKTNGFSKTLQKFLSEAKLDLDDSRKDCSLDLEQVYYNFLETRDCIVSVEETVSKKNKWKSGKSDCNAVDNQCQTKDKFRNAKKSEDIVTDDLVPESAVISKMEKKRKTTSGSIKEVAEQVRPDVLTESDNGIVNEPLLDELKKKHKDKKKKKAKSGSQKDDFQTSKDAAINKENKDSKKRKRLASEDNNSQPIDKVAIEGKRRKTEGMEESQLNMQLTELEASLGSDGHTDKVSKEQNGKVCFNYSQERAIKQLDTDANGNLEKYIENSSVQKSSKKQHNGSVEPKTVNAFQRVKIDKVVFTDERLQDNSYWAKDGAEIGYGAKAQEVLGQVRGRDFRHEKTKKKRGSYRGGQIDLHSHSVKFNYSDED